MYIRASPPDAPPLSETTMGCFIRLFFWTADCIIRAIWSEAPPAPAATTISTGLVGSHANAGGAISAAPATAPATKQAFFSAFTMMSSPPCVGRWSLQPPHVHFRFGRTPRSGKGGAGHYTAPQVGFKSRRQPLCCCLSYCCGIFAATTTLAHLTVSDLRYEVNFSEVEGTASMPWASNFCFMSG